MKQIYELEQVIEKEAGKGDFDGVFSLKEHSDTPYFYANTNLRTKEVTIGYNSEYQQERNRDPTIVTRAITNHEILHHGQNIQGLEVIGVPGDIETSQTHFFEPMYNVLSKKGFSEQDVLYAENTLEDTLLHLSGKSYTNWVGVTDFFRDIGKTKEFSDYCEAHVKLNMLLWGLPEQKAQMQQFYKGEGKTTEALKGFLEKTNMINPRGVIPEQELRDYFLNKDNWPEISRIYAEEFSKLMTPDYAMPLLNHSGKGTRGRESEDSSKEGNVFQKQRQTPQYKEGEIIRAHKKGEEFPEWLKDTKEKRIQSLDILYQRLAKELKIKAESTTNPEAMPIFHMNYEEYNPIKHGLKDLEPRRTRTGEIDLVKKTDPFTIEIPIKIHTKSFPKAKYVQSDTSSSMKLNPEGRGDVGSKINIPWGDNSRYHYSLLAWYGFIGYLNKNGLLSNKTDLELHSFSSSTKSAKGLSEAKKLALNPDFRGSTRLDKRSLEDVFSGRDNLIMMISDGEIQNWGEVSPTFLRGVKDNYCLWLQIGNLTPSSLEAKEAGATVVPVRGYNDLPRTVIDLTRNLRKGGLQQ